MGDRLCALGEPTTLLCVRRRDGALLWRHEHPVVDALPPDEQARLAPKIAAGAAALESLRGLQTETSRLRRALRAGEDVASQLQAVSEGTFALQALVAEVDPYLTPPNQEMIGYATPTPATDGTSLVALFGNGVLVRRDREGALLWSRWLGVPPTPMDGYPIGTTTSPLWIGDLLVVGYGNLRGIDPATGKDAWVGAPWRSLGTPVVAKVGGEDLLVTPDGQVVRPSDGEVLVEGLPTTSWSSPTVDGDRVWFAGGRGEAHVGVRSNEAWMVQLGTGANGVTVEQVWHATVPATARLYASPVVTHGRLYMVSDLGQLAVLDAGTGAVLHSLDLPSVGHGHQPSLVVAGDHLFVANERGVTTVIDVTAPEAKVVSVNRGVGQRSTPVVDGSALYMRTLQGLVAWGDAG